MNTTEIEIGIQKICDTSITIKEYYINREALIAAINVAPKDELAKCKNFYANRSGVVIDLRKELIDRLLANETFTVASAKELIDKYKKGNENSYRAYKKWFSLFFPVLTFYGHDPMRDFMKRFIEKFISDLGLQGLVDVSNFDFQGARQQGNDRWWVAVFNKEQPSHSSSKQFFFEILEGKINYGIYRHSDKSYLKPKQTVEGDNFKYADMLSYFKEYTQLLIEDVPEIKNNNIHLEEENVYKISMGPDYFSEEDIEASIEKKLVLVHSHTKPKGRATKSQADIFKEDMQIGDYFYLTRGNQGIKILGQITSDAVPATFNNLYDDGWLERSYQIIAKSNKSGSYKDEGKYWAPNTNVTCWPIPANEMEQANDILFEPYFGLRFINAENNFDFKKIIDEFKEALTQETSILKDFSLGTYTDKSHYVKISDHKNVIGTANVHYEIRSIKSGLAVELHFEGNDNNKNSFKKIQLPPSLEWFEWMSANSIRHKGFISKEEKDIVPQLISKLEVMENQIGDQIRSIMENENNSQIGKSNIKLNQILYGPPGTGKTYSTILEAAQIISKKEIKNYKKALEIFNANLEDQIEFITFHQNYSYEDFIQGLRPDVEHTSLSFNRTDGIFTKIAVNALFEYYKLFQKKQREEIQNPKAIDINEAYLEFLNHLEVGQEFDTRTGEKVKITGFTDRQNIEFKPIKGNRPYLVSGNRLIKLYKNFPAIEKIQRVHEDIRSAIGGCNASIYYVALREFIEYLNDYEVDDDILGAAEDEGFNYEDIPYNRKKELLANTDLSDLRSIRSSEVPNYVIIIDEINRANISRVFGELITLIEKDKRSHGEIPLKVTLPSGEKFIVPSNLFIIGTMNTADKSIALLDIALRRRFEFVPMYPKYDIEDAIINENNLLEKINLEIISRKGHDFTIGHSYFMGIEFSLENTINNKVLPLMLEYFMNDHVEVKKILNNCGILLKEEWPMKFAGLKND